MPLSFISLAAAAAAATVAGLSIFVTGVGAQTTNAVCLPQSSEPWTNNTRQQSPCFVASNLEAICTPGPFNLQPLQGNQTYVGPASFDANVCTCSTVVYNLMSECGLCQGKGIIPWSRWHANCAGLMISIAKWPFSVPAETSIPAWAFYDPTGSDTFDRAQAGKLALLPDVSATATGATLPTSSASASVSSTVPINIGAIVGGVVGGVVFIVLVIVAVVVVLRLLKRRTTELSPSQQYMKDPVYGLNPNAARSQFGSRGAVSPSSRSTMPPPARSKPSPQSPPFPQDELLTSYYASNGGISRDPSANAHSINGSFSQLSHTQSQPNSSPRIHHASPVGSINTINPWQQQQQHYPQSIHEQTEPLYPQRQPPSAISSSQPSAISPSQYSATSPSQPGGMPPWQQYQPQRKQHPYSYTGYAV